MAETSKMHHEPRWEIRDYRDREQRQQIQQPRAGLNTRTLGDHLGKALRVIGATAFIGLTMYNLYIIGGWLSDWYARKRAARIGHWKRARKWKRRVIIKR